ncbi:AMP-binding protein [Stenotrophomonas maltophilia]|uniref:AMP-binding protein n=1 Tax=Stenotrophomonas maltophilia TaxID=40324 RepID=A0A6B8J8Z1_STEMA|nr:AMP-binding protein [Stenotrophomonas maltophilia]MBH1652544.1 AMP-binding protein [Stenotrophomonas maltophilia]QGM02107.1 long-chain fatty acid--CoA ligase [Stenotrophomonas maltophilia]HDS1512133.1 AMP-binding protein [Stenotrophomonas maltophilia]
MKFSTLLERARQYSASTFSARRVDGSDHQVTFPTLLDEVETLATRLTQAGVRPGMQIGLQVGNGYEHVLWDLAAIRLGVLIHAVPEELTSEKLAALMQRHDTALWVCENPDALPGHPYRCNIADTWTDRPIIVDIEAGVVDDPDLYTKVYSSGSSGYLKGLSISRLGTEALVADFIGDFALDSRDSHLIFLPLSNYQQRLSVYGCLWAGASLRVVRHTSVFQELGAFKPSFIVAPPAIYENIFHVHGRGSHPAEKLGLFLGGNIRFMITGMAPIRTELLRAYNELGFQLLEAYGVTETGMIAWNTPAVHRAGSVGRPIHPEHLHFTDEAEVVIRRPFPLAKGYFESTGSDGTQTFLTDGTIATGDVGSLDADGFLYLKGRKKEIILTSGGAKFHPEELERKLTGFSWIRHAIVLQSKRAHEVVAILVASDAAEVPDSDVVDEAIRSLNRSLPGYMHIARKVVTQTAPTMDNGMLTRNLKYDRKGIYRHFQEEIEGVKAWA